MIVINLDIMMAKRKISSGELAESLLIKSQVFFEENFKMLICYF